MTRQAHTFHCTEGCARELIAGQAGFRSARPRRLGWRVAAWVETVQVLHVPYC